MAGGQLEFAGGGWVSNDEVRQPIVGNHSTHQRGCGSHQNFQQESGRTCIELVEHASEAKGRLGSAGKGCLVTAGHLPLGGYR